MPKDLELAQVHVQDEHLLVLPLVSNQVQRKAQCWDGEAIWPYQKVLAPLPPATPLNTWATSRLTRLAADSWWDKTPCVLPETDLASQNLQPNLLLNFCHLTETIDSHHSSLQYNNFFLARNVEHDLNSRGSNRRFFVQII